MAAEQSHLHSGIYTGAEIQEGVLQLIYQIVPEDTPLLLIAGRGKATNVQHEWLFRRRGARAGTSGENRAVPPGEGFTQWTQGGSGTNKYADLAVPTRDVNYCEIFRVIPRVDETTLAVNMHGVRDIFADQLEFRAADFAIYIEERGWNGTQNAGPTSDSATAGDYAWEMGGLVAEITNNVLDVGGATITDVNMQNIFNRCWADGGRPQDLFCGPVFKSELTAALPTTVTNFVDMNNVGRKQIVNTISVYEGATQTITVHLTRDLDDGAATTTTAAAAGNEAILLDRSFVSFDWLREPFIERLPRYGGFEAARIEGQVTLNFGDERAHGEILDIQIRTGLI